MPITFRDFFSFPFNSGKGVKADQVDVATGSFSGHLGTGDDDLQKALETIDGITAGMGGLSTVSTDSTIGGDGSPGSPLSVVSEFTAALRAKLNAIEADATADQTASEIATAYEGIAGVNRLTNALLTKLNDIEDNATADQTASEIAALYEGIAGVNRFTNALLGKLNAIESGAKDDQSAGEVSVDASSFGTNLSPSDTDVQAALATIDGLTIGGGGGGGITAVATTLAGGEVEELFNNLDSSETALGADLAARSWADANTLRIDMGRALAATDDDKWLVLYGSFVANSVVRNLTWIYSAHAFRLFAAITSGSANVSNTAVQYMRRNNDAGTFGWSEMAVHFGRTRLGTGNDQLRIGFGSNQSNDLSIGRFRLALIPWAAGLTATSVPS